MPRATGGGPEWTVELPEAWRTAPFDQHMIEVVAEAKLPKGRTALVVMAMLEDGTVVVAMTWDRGTRLARIAPPDWKLEERFTGRPPGPGEGVLIDAWRVGVESLMRAAKLAAEDEERDPEGTEQRAMAIYVLRHPKALDAAWEAYRERVTEPVSRDVFETGLKILAGVEVDA